MILRTAGAGLTTPAVVGRGLSEGLGLARLLFGVLLKLVSEQSAVSCIANIDERTIRDRGEFHKDEFFSGGSSPRPYLLFLGEASRVP